MVRKSRAVLALCALGVAAAQSSTVKPGDAELNQAYQALVHKDYDAAIALFRSGLAKQPGNAAVHKDLAYTLLKAGENEEARDEFEAAMRANPQDDTAALEYAFLAYETKKPIEARRMFDRLRHSGTSVSEYRPPSCRRHRALETSACPSRQSERSFYFQCALGAGAACRVTG